MNESLTLSIIVVSYNTKELLRTCLASIMDNLPSFKAEILVIDNASTDGSSNMVTEEFPAVKLLRNRQNVGFARANNQLIKDSVGRYVLLLNSDTVVLPEALEQMVKAMDANPKAGVVGCRLLNTDGSVQPPCALFQTAW